MVRSRKTVLAFLVLTAVGLFGGCSSFERDWKALAAPAIDAVHDRAAPAAVASDLTGRWEGTWQSTVNDHTGGLRCIITATGADAIDARFHATYGWFFTFEYTVPMTTREDGDAHRFTGAADLGWLAGGLYSYEGSVVGDVFTSTYESERDRGTFEMTRVREGDDGSDPDGAAAAHGSK